MLPDRFFYPLAVMVIAAIVAAALSFGGPGERADIATIIDQGWEMDGQALSNLTVSPGTDLSFVEDGSGGYVRLVAYRPRDIDPPSIGVFATLNSDYEQAFEGRTIRLTLRARQSAQDGLDAFQTAYVPLEYTRSPWQNFTLGEDWADYRFEFTTRILDVEPSVDYFAIYPGIDGERKAMDLASIRIEVVP